MTNPPLPLPPNTQMERERERARQHWQRLGYFPTVCNSQRTGRLKLGTNSSVRVSYLGGSHQCIASQWGSGGPERGVGTGAEASPPRATAPTPRHAVFMGILPCMLNASGVPLPLPPRQPRPPQPLGLVLLTACVWEVLQEGCPLACPVFVT